MKEGETSDVVATLRHAAKAIGMTKIAEETGLSRPSLYKALSEGSKPQFSTLMKVVKAVVGEIQIAPASIDILKKTPTIVEVLCAGEGTRTPTP